MSASLGQRRKLALAGANGSVHSSGMKEAKVKGLKGSRERELLLKSISGSNRTAATDQQC